MKHTSIQYSQLTNIIYVVQGKDKRPLHENEIKILKAILPAYDDWIPVEKELPEIGEYVLVYNTERATLVGKLMSNGWVALFKDGENFMGELTAMYWQPLPQPPKR